MNINDFIFWLKGYLDIEGKERATKMDSIKLDCIKEHLRLVKSNTRLQELSEAKIEAYEFVSWLHGCLDSYEFIKEDKREKFLENIFHRLEKVYRNDTINDILDISPHPTDQFGVMDCQKPFEVDTSRVKQQIAYDIFKVDEATQSEVYDIGESIYNNPTGAGIRSC